MNFKIKGHAFSRKLVTTTSFDKGKVLFLISNEKNLNLESVEFNESECCKFLDAITEFNIIQRIFECPSSEL